MTTNPDSVFLALETARTAFTGSTYQSRMTNALLDSLPEHCFGCFLDQALDRICSLRPRSHPSKRLQALHVIDLSINGSLNGHRQADRAAVRRDWTSR